LGERGPNGGSTQHPKLEAEKEKSESNRPKGSLMKAKVLIIHGMPLLRFGLAKLVGSTRRFEICGETHDAPTARELFLKHQPQLVVLGLTLRGGDGIELIKDFRKLDTTTKTVVLSVREDSLLVQRAFRAGAHGYLLANDDVPEILKALDQIVAGNVYATSRVWRRLLEDPASGTIESATAELTHLSDRELQVFSLIGRGFGATRLANELHLSVKTIETYQMHIKEKLGLRSAAELSQKATSWMLHSVRRNLQLRRKLFSTNRHSRRQRVHLC
jgi:DNA-binding NarL/FixJ family response regulator